jgi:hypothetical protein
LSNSPDGGILAILPCQTGRTIPGMNGRMRLLVVAG